MAGNFASNFAMEVTAGAVRIYGGYGSIRECRQPAPEVRVPLAAR
jgi:alkylation response protein AidB-like acyl-CoA dehydrogenase